MGTNIKDLIASFTGKKKNSNLVTIGRYNYDCPEVRINDTELTITLGQWMGTLPDAVKSGGNGMFVISHLDANELVARKGLSKIDFAKILRKFSNILAMAGFGSGNTCILDCFDSDNLTFRCTFEETGEVANMRIRFGSWLDEGPAFVVEFDGIKSTYDYWHEDKKNPDRLHLSHVVKKLDEKSNKEFYHYVSEFRYIASVYDDENKVEIEVKYPESLDYGHTTNPYVNKELLEEIISSVSFPVDIESIVSRIPEGLIGDVNTFPTISVKISKLGEKDFVTTDEAIFTNGEFTKLTVTKNGKKVTVDNFDTWSYSTDIANVSQTMTPKNDRAISYGYKSIPVDEFEHLESPQVLVNEAKEYVEEVKTLGKTMLQKRTR